LKGGNMVVRKSESGNFEVKKWVAILTIISLLVTFAYSFAMTFNLLPIKVQVEENKIINEEQSAVLHDLDKRVDINVINFQHIENKLDEIKELIKNGR